MRADQPKRLRELEKEAGPLRDSAADLSLDSGVVIDGLRELSEMGRLEFIGSAKYHPIQPRDAVQPRSRQTCL